jgi:hypothetical protein
MDKVSPVKSERDLRLYVVDQAERALEAWEKRTGREADARLWAACAAARGYAEGDVTAEELARARASAWAAAWAMDWSPAWEAALAATEAAVRDTNG